MKKLYLLSVILLATSFYGFDSLAQNDSALPSIPNQQTPVTIDTPPIAPESEQDRKIFNPLQAVLEKEQKQKSGEQTKYWVNPELAKDQDQETKAAKIEEDGATQANDQQRQSSTEPNLEVKTPSKTDTESSEKDNDGLSEAEIKTLQDNVAAQVKENNTANDVTAEKEDTEATAKAAKKDHIKRVKEAVKALPKPTEPERLWSID